MLFVDRHEKKTGVFYSAEFKDEEYTAQVDAVYKCPWLAAVAVLENALKRADSDCCENDVCSCC